jgi:hypothetical protein
VAATSQLVATDDLILCDNLVVVYLPAPWWASAFFFLFFDRWVCLCVNLRAVERDGFFWVVKCSFCLFVRDKGLMEQQPIITYGETLDILSAAAAGPTSCSEKTVGSLWVCAFVDGSVISLDLNSCDKMPFGD